MTKKLLFKPWRCLFIAILGFIFVFTAIPKVQTVAKQPPVHELSAALVIAQLPSVEKLQTIPLSEHPRLIVSEERFAEIKQELKTDPTMQQWYTTLQKQAKTILNEELPQYEIPDGKRLLKVSKRLLEDISILALMYRLEANPQYLNRAWQELEVAAQFPDWNPSHFLDTAEMAHAFAIGYDWLYRDWNDRQRNLLRAAIIKQALYPALTAYQQGKRWTKITDNNWNQVCNGGVAIAALALLDSDPLLASQNLYEALQRLPQAMEHYAPDGGWNEGAVYWHYATNYNTLALAALDTALGTDFNLSKISGFAATGLFPIYITNAFGKPFNFADSNDRTIRAPELFWLSEEFQQPAYNQYQQQYATPEPLDLIWYETEINQTTLKQLPLDKHFRGAEIVSMRSDWEDPNGIFVGFKAGTNQVNHGNLDLGTFVLDSLGVRWAVELGKDDYNLPGYFDKKDQRWTYYRTRAEGQNTLVVNPDGNPDQNIEARTKIVRFQSQRHNAYAIADLTPAYYPKVRQLKRGIKLNRRRKQVILQDEIQAEQPVELWWFMHTQADIEIDKNGKTALLSQDGQRLWVKLLKPRNLRLTVMDARPLDSSPVVPNQGQNTGIKKLAIESTGVTEEKISVLFVSLAPGQNPPWITPRVRSLDSW